MMKNGIPPLIPPTTSSSPTSSSMSSFPSTPSSSSTALSLSSSQFDTPSSTQTSPTFSSVSSSASTPEIDLQSGSLSPTSPFNRLKLILLPPRNGNIGSSASLSSPSLSSSPSTMQTELDQDELSVIEMALDETNEVKFRDEVMRVWSLFHSLTTCNDKSVIFKHIIESLASIFGNDKTYTIHQLDEERSMKPLIVHHGGQSWHSKSTIPNHRDDNFGANDKESCSKNTSPFYQQTPNTTFEALYSHPRIIEIIETKQLLPIIYSHGCQCLRIPLISNLSNVIGEIQISNLSDNNNIYYSQLIHSSYFFRYLIKKTVSEVQRLKYEGLIDHFVEFSCNDISNNELFHSLSKYLAYYLNVKFSLICMISPPDTGVTISYCIDGKIQDNVVYKLSDTPCGIVSHGRPVCINDHLQERFPQDVWLRLNGIKSYIGIPLVDTNGDNIGHLVACDTKPINPTLMDNSIIVAIANKACHELERRKCAEDGIVTKEILNRFTSTCIFLTDSKGIVNRVFGEQLFECHAQILSGSSIDSILLNANGEDRLSTIIPSVNEGKAEVLCKKRSGTIFTAEVYCKIISIKKINFTGKLFFVRDITEEKNNQKVLLEARDRALEAANMRSQFMATISHEIRTPMNGLIGLVELLLSSDLQPGQKQIVESLYKSAEHLYSITSDILDFTKMEASKFNLEIINFDFRGCVEGVLNTLQLSLKKPIEIQSKIDPSIPTIVKGDPNRLRQIIYNICFNSIKYTDQGFIKVDVKLLSQQSATKKVIEFIVEDTGIGIEPNQQGTLFQPFVQLDNSSRSHSGTGLGLSIVKKIVEMMNGDIRLVESKPGFGSKFSFTIILENGEESRSRKKSFDQDCTSNNSSCGNSPSTHLNIHSPNNSQQHKRSKSSFDFIEEAKEFIINDGNSNNNNNNNNQDNMTTSSPTTTSTGTPQHFEKRQKFVNGDIMINQQQQHHQQIVDFNTTNGTIDNNSSINLSIDPLSPQPPLLSLLPTISASTSPPTISSITTATANNSQPKKYRILVAEDNEVNQKVLLLQLSKLGYRDVDLAQDGLEAIEMFKQKKYDLVFLDLNMPNCDGSTASLRIRSFEELAGLPKTKIIALTAMALSGYQEFSHSCGMDDFLRKPLRINDLSSLLNRYIPLRDDNNNHICIVK